MAENNKINLHQGHRQRMKKRFLEHGLEFFDDYQLLEVLLFYAVPKKDTNEMAHMLINRFGSLSGVMRADFDELTEVKGIGENAASLIKYIQMFSQRFLRTDFDYEKKVSLNNTDAITDYCKTLYLGENNESLYAIALDADLCVAKVKRLFTGTPDSVAVSSRSIAEFVMKSKCGAVIISHNHPNGSCLPSRNDIAVTEDVGIALSGMSIDLIDHVIVGRDGTMCMSRSPQWRNNW